MSSDIGPHGHEHDYLTRREAQERVAAAQSDDPAARRAHEQLAERYAAQLSTSAL